MKAASEFQPSSDGRNSDGHRPMSKSEAGGSNRKQNRRPDQYFTAGPVSQKVAGQQP